MLSITRAARTSDTQLIKIFVNKEGLLEAIFAEGLKLALAALEDMSQIRSAREKLRLFGIHLLQRLEGEPDLRRVLIFDLGRFRRKLGGGILLWPEAPTLFAALLEWFQEAKQSGELKPDLSPDLACVLFSVRFVNGFAALSIAGRHNRRMHAPSSKSPSATF